MQFFFEIEIDGNLKRNFWNVFENNLRIQNFWKHTDQIQIKARSLNRQSAGYGEAHVVTHLLLLSKRMKILERRL